MKIRLKDIEFDLREGTREDVPTLLRFIRAMAEFEKLEVTATEETLRTSLFGDRPAAHALLAFHDATPIAYVIYFFTFSTMLGKRGLWLDDLFVDPAFRRRGIARALIRHLAQLALENDCGRFEWTVLDWNERAIQLYEKMGVRLLNDWRVCRLDSDGIRAVAQPNQ